MLESQAHRVPPMDPGNYYGHSRTRTASSNTNTYPAQPQSQAANPNQHNLLAHAGAPQNLSRRSPSVNTFNTTSSMQPPAAYRISSSSDLRRSTSSRSGGASSQQQPATGYVALLRKQKATVWCDRAQYEDPRLLAQQRAAKVRANLEVVGGSRYGSTMTAASRTNTGISGNKVTSRIRHPKAPVSGYAPGENHVGVGGVPERLSATEVEEAESSEEDDAQTMSRVQHRRTGSGRSSTGSGRPNLAYRTSLGQASQNAIRRSPNDTPERTASLPHSQTEATSKTIDDAASGRAQSSKSGSSAERADGVGELGTTPRLASKSMMHSALTREKSVKTAEELKRRGSVDERTATLTSGRLYIANPD